MKSVVSYPNRGNYGKNSYRGNTSGLLIKDLIEFASQNTKTPLEKFLFVDACEGSGTSRDVCKELNCQYVGLDLHKGNDFLKDSILTSLNREADIVFTHPPYAEMIQYSGKQWGNKLIEDDLSNPNISKDEFLEKSQVMLLNQREATRQNGLYATLIGDMRKKGQFWSFQADYQAMMPKNELISVVIKMQHNCMSDNRTYGGSFIPILHEYLLVWKKSSQSLYQIAWNKAIECKHQLAATWRSAIRIAFMKLGGKATLQDIYGEIAKIAQNLIQNNKNWEAKIRQTLQKHFTNVQRGVWAV
jgi:DNA-binding ferritin-like protein (Dps family)